MWRVPLCVGGSPQWRVPLNIRSLVASVNRVYEVPECGYLHHPPPLTSASAPAQLGRHRQYLLLPRHVELWQGSSRWNDTNCAADNHGRALWHHAVEVWWQCLSYVSALLPPPPNTPSLSNPIDSLCRSLRDRRPPTRSESAPQHFNLFFPRHEARTSASRFPHNLECVRST